jgi:hypothetical protein
MDAPIVLPGRHLVDYLERVGHTDQPGDLADSQGAVVEPASPAESPAAPVEGHSGQQQEIQF